jgi:transcriptional regulator GlxA family with amidase domain
LIEQFGREIVLDDGEAVLISGTDPSSFTHKPPGNILALRITKSRLIPMLKHGDESYMRRIPAESAALAMLRNYVGLTWGGHILADSAMQGLMSNHLFDLIAVTAGASSNAAEAARGNGLHAARLQTIKQEIARKLDDPGLSVATVAGQHCMTPRSLQRLFEAEGTTFTQYVLEQRLKRAHGMLVSGAGGAAKISTVAYDCGFGDVSYFNRAFRRHYGAAPSDIRARRR